MALLTLLILTLAASSVEAQKKGIIDGLNSRSNTAVCSSGCRNISWVYNYGQTPASGGYPSGLEYVPMLRDISTSSLSSWSSNAAAASSKGSTHVMGFNEPDYGAGISPTAAAQAWITYMNPLTKYQKVSPSVTNSAASGQGLNWLASFIAACNGKCKIDYIGLHWYGSVSSATLIVTYAQQANKQFGLPVWITEYAFTDGSDAQQAAALKQAITSLSSASYIYRHAYFACVVGSGFLLSSSTAQSVEGNVWCST